MPQCKKCQVDYKITEKDQKFYKKLDVPEPLECPDCRQQKRLAYRNERVLYKRKCDKCSKSIVSTFSSDKSFPVYDPGMGESLRD